MLIRFNTGNFLSFNAIQELSMISGKVKSKPHHLEIDGDIKLLKFGAIFGANASGKSNIIKAINFAQSVILKGVDNAYSNSYFKLGGDNESKPSYFEFEIKVKDKFYAYGFEIILNKNEIISEWLHKISSKSSFIIFERDLKKRTFHTEVNMNRLNSDLRNRIEVYSDDLKAKTDILFLSEMNRSKEGLYKEISDFTVLRDVYHWFNSSLRINYPDLPISNYSYFYNDMETEKIIDVIRSFSTGITSFKVIDASLEEATESFPKQLIKELEKDINQMIMVKKSNKKPKLKTITIRTNDNIFILSVNDSFELEVKTVVFEHEHKGITFKLSEESDGTRRILDLIEILVTDNKETVYVIDEIDRSLHPQLTYRFVETFLNTVKLRKNQLIATTHESRLLDFNILRRDEVWFVDKNDKGESSIYSLEEYNERFDKKIDKAYLEGRYGGVPVFSTVFPVKGVTKCE